MIKFARLKNIQSHADTHIEFHEGVTAIVGLSDAGKSAFLRGIRAVCYRGPIYIKNFETDGSVELGFDNCNLQRIIKISIPRKCDKCKSPVDKTMQQCAVCNAVIDKSTTVDKFVLDGKEIEKFGTTLPEMILEKSKFRETLFVDFEERLQFSSQHQDMFFIGTSYEGGKRNKILSCLIPESSKIDFLLKKLISDIQDKKALSELLMKQNIFLNNAIEQGRTPYEEIKRLDLEIINSRKTILDNNNRKLSLEKIKSNIEPHLKLNSITPKLIIVINNIKKIQQFYTEKIVNLFTKYTSLSKFKGLKKPIVKPIIPVLEATKLESLMSKYARLKNIRNQIAVDLKIKNKSATVGKIETISSLDKIESLNKKFNRIEFILRLIKINSQDIHIAKNDKAIINSELTKLKQKYNVCLGSSQCPLIQDKYCDSCIAKLKV